MSGRTPFFVFSVGAHVALAVGLGRMHVSESHAATAIEMADVPKPKKEPPKAVVEPEPPKLEHHVARRAAAPAPPPPAVNTPPPPVARSRVALADALPDFGLSLSGAVGGDGVAVPLGLPSGQAAAAPRTAPAHRALAAQSGPSSTGPACDEPATKPHPISVPQPSYNANATAAGVEGKVRVRITVDETGKVVDASILAGLGYGLDEAALAAARQATFEPATQCGKPVRATFTISMRFNLG
jgi:protein TonB